MSVRLNFIVEGQTEEAFVKDVLAPHLANQAVWAYARPVRTSQDRGQIFSGGLRSYAKARRDILSWMRRDRNPDARFTTMFDLYALPTDFPGYEAARRERDPYARVSVLEDALRENIGDRRFVPYLQLHEFEALLFADPEKLNAPFPDRSQEVRRLVQLAQGQNPELINDGQETAPSKRIIEEIPEYQRYKATLGPIVTELIGLPALLSRCRHFAEWIGRLEALPQT